MAAVANSFARLGTSIYNAYANIQSPIAIKMSASDTSPSQNEGASELVAVLIAITRFSARVLTVLDGQSLPFGALSPVHRSLQSGVRQWVKTQTRQPMGYVEQLYTFVDTTRTRLSGHPVLYVSYLGLVKETDESQLEAHASWQDWYYYFPWEDHRQGLVPWVMQTLLPSLQDWVHQESDPNVRMNRQRRVDMCWGLNGFDWVEEHVLLRYELMYEAGLIPEAPNYASIGLGAGEIGVPMQRDHRRVLATAMSRLRAKIKYRPVIAELMPAEFTLFQLQKSIEGLAGVELHKQNFRRMIQHQDLVEETGKMTAQDRGRPARLYKFKDHVLLENILAGSKLPQIK
ncbi:membrane protein [Advenella faeciporci]|uniref:Membrane protein n=2 Tax=Advenella faeciporci TaxID=797535 RepID=A0A918JNM4_9BURK|nr:hypothetical protein [Advenella faeciporci]GGW86384.1 membrane protein [Advenella faeciporci]